MDNKDDSEKNPVARLREIFFEIKRNIRPSPELLEILKKMKESKDQKKDPNKKVAMPSPPEADL